MQVKEIFIWEQNKRKPHKFHYSMTITNIPQLA